MSNKIPKLYPKDRDINRQWFIKYYDAVGRPHKMFGEMNNLPTVKEREKEAKRLMKKIAHASGVKKQQKGRLLANLEHALGAAAQTIRPQSKEIYTGKLAQFSAWYNKKKMANPDVNPNTFITFLKDEKKRKPSTINGYTSLLKKWFGSVVEDGLYPQNPFIKTQSVRGNCQSWLPFSSSQIEVLLPLIKDEDATLHMSVLLMYYLFVRPSEARVLKVDHILLDEECVQIIGETAKDHDTELVSIPKPFLPILKAWISGVPGNYYILGKKGRPSQYPIGKSYLQYKHKLIMTRLNYGPRYVLYSWVYTGIKESVKAGIPINQLKEQKRHHSLDMFMQYLKNWGLNDSVQLRQNFPALPL